MTQGLNLFVLIHRSKEVEGIWLAHVPDLDLVVQARGVTAVVDAVREGIVMALDSEWPTTLPVRNEKSVRDEILKLMHHGTFEMLTMPQLEQRSAQIEAAVLHMYACRTHAVHEPLAGMHPGLWADESVNDGASV